MAGADQPSKVLPPGPRTTWQGPLGTLGWALAWADFATYKVEFAVVVTAMVVMTVIEFVYILSIYVTEQRIRFTQLLDPELEHKLPIGLIILGLFVLAMMVAIVNNTRLGLTPEGDKRPLAVRALAAAGLMLGVTAISASTIWFDSSTSFYILLTLLIMGPIAAWFFARREPIVGGGMVGATGLALWAATQVPTGYSWADNFALFLLLWIGFLGASMAAKQNRHLRVDAARKLWPKAHFHRINGVSDLVAASFCGLLTYIGTIYLFNEDYGRWWAADVPGQIPDWIKVAAIPLAFLLMTLRMGSRGLVRLIWGPLFQPPDDHDPLSAAASEGLPLGEVNAHSLGADGAGKEEAP